MYSLNCCFIFIAEITSWKISNFNSYLSEHRNQQEHHSINYWNWYSCCFITDEDMFFVPRVIHNIESSGVRFDSWKIQPKQRRFKINIKYVESDTTSKGVRNDNKPIYHKPNQIMNCLDYNRPCLCGSLTHQRINHSDCLLNPNYYD
jgi:hypothetical protein